MAKTISAAKIMDEIGSVVPRLIVLPDGHIQTDYDREADVLYISFRRPQKATETVFDKKRGMLVRYRGKEMVGVTVLNASRRRPARDQQKPGEWIETRETARRLTANRESGNVQALAA